jgi:hypothetical protein
MDYDPCSSSSPLAMFQTGDDTIPLPAGGVTRYFICGMQGHCNSGMKLAIKVDQGRRCCSRRWTGRRRGPVTCSAASSAGGVASLVGLSLQLLSWPYIRKKNQRKLFIIFHVIKIYSCCFGET